jgi:hypothetical protein
LKIKTFLTIYNYQIHNSILEQFKYQIPGFEYYNDKHEKLIEKLNLSDDLSIFIALKIVALRISRDADDIKTADLQLAFINRYADLLLSNNQYIIFDTNDEIGLLKTILKLKEKTLIINKMRDFIEKSNNTGELYGAFESLSSALSKDELIFFLTNLKKQNKNRYYRKMLNALSKYIECEVVQNFFVELLNKKLNTTISFHPNEINAIIEVLTPYIEKLNLKDSILKLIKKNNYKAACIRALCVNPQKMLINKEFLIDELGVNSNVDDASQAALIAWANNQETLSIDNTSQE